MSILPVLIYFCLLRYLSSQYYLYFLGICEPQMPYLALYSPGDTEYTDVLVRREKDNLTLVCEVRGDTATHVFVWNYVSDNGTDGGRWVNAKEGHCFGDGHNMSPEMTAKHQLASPGTSDWPHTCIAWGHWGHALRFPVHDRHSQCQHHVSPTSMGHMSYMLCVYCDMLSYIGYFFCESPHPWFNCTKILRAYFSLS